MAEAVFLSFKHGNKQKKARLADDGSLGLGSLAVGLGLDPMSVSAGDFSLEYNPSTGRCQDFAAVLQSLRQGAKDALLGTSSDKPILLEGTPAAPSSSAGASTVPGGGVSAPAAGTNVAAGQEGTGLIEAVGALTQAANKLVVVADVASRMLSWHAGRLFRYSPSNITQVRDPDFKKAIVKAYGAKLPGQPGKLRDNLLNEYLPSSIVIAAHIFKREWKDYVATVLGFSNIDDKRNALLLNKFCESAFDNGYLVLMWQLAMKSNNDIDAGAGHPPDQEVPEVDRNAPPHLSYDSSAASRLQPDVAPTGRLNALAPAFTPQSSALRTFNSMSQSARSSSSSNSSNIQAARLPPRSSAMQSLADSSSSAHTPAGSSRPAAQEHNGSSCQVTNSFEGGQVVAYYLGDLDMVAADCAKWPWGCADIDDGTKSLLKTAFQDRTVRQLVEGKPLTFMTQQKHRPLLRCLLFQAAAVIRDATGTGRLMGDRATMLQELLQHFKDHVQGVSPAGSAAMQKFFDACQATAPVAEPAE